MTPPPAGPRIAWLDRARGVAVIGMVLFHLARDLEIFGWLPRGTTLRGGWPPFSTLVAGGFLMLSGFSLWLSHGRGIRWPAFLRRLALLALAAGAVTLATWIATPDRFVYFGILHALALSAVAGLALLRLPAPALIGLAGLILLLPARLTGPSFDHPALWWLGLAPFPRPTLDFEPMLPWFAPFVIGMALAKLAPRRWLTRGPAAGDLPAWLGRHSLAVYLIHQPVLLALLWTARQIALPGG